MEENNIGKKIKAIREDNKMTQEYFSHKVLISRSLLSQIEAGKSIPTAETINKIVSVFKIDANYLFSDAKTENVIYINNLPVKDELLKSYFENTVTTIFTNIAEYKRLEQKLNTVLKGKKDIEVFFNAAIEIAMFKHTFAELNDKYLSMWLNFPSTKESDLNATFELLHDQLEKIKPFTDAFINLAKAIHKFNTEMFESGDKSFAFAQK